MTGLTVEVPLISIVDDNEAFRTAIIGLVRSIGHETRGFKSAEEFLQSPELRETSCVISDVQMPGMSGLELQSKLDAQNIGIPIIFISANPDARVQESALRAGAVCFLKKLPFHEQDLINCLGKALRQKRRGLGARS